MKTAIVLAFERLPLRLLGCYGGEIATPGFDRFAAESTVFDQHFSENVDESAAGHAWWTGRHEFPQHSSMQRWFDALRRAGTEITACVESTQSRATTCPFATEPPIAASFGSRGLLEAASKWLSQFTQQPTSNRLLWLQSASIAPPGDGSMLQRQSQAAAEVKELDSHFAGLWDAIAALRQSPGDELLFVVTAAQGAELGEQEQLPDQFRLPDPLRRLAEPVVHAPLMIGMPRASGTRRRELTQTIDLAPTLLDWFGVSCEGFDFAGYSLLPFVGGIDRSTSVARTRERLFLGDDGRAFGVRDHEASLMTTPAALQAEDEPSPEQQRLFVKPDDVWDGHNVADQEPAAVESLAEALREFLRGVGGGTS